jgi:sortase A
VEIPVVYDVNTIEETAVEKGLERGVVHYADTAVPGQNGNVVIVGHSSNNIFNQGQYKFAFVLLSRLDNGDTFYLQRDGKRYTYQVYDKKIVKPTDVSVLGPAEKPATATLITCDPPGTSTNRLVVTAEQISPDPAVNVAAATNSQLATASAVIPGNSPTLWSRLIKWFEQ